MPHREGEAVYPKDRVFWPVARRIVEEFERGQLDDDELVSELEALDDYLAGE